MQGIDNIGNILSGPADYLCKHICAQIALVPQFAALFGPRIDAYQRLDYSMRELPALRVYNNSWTKEFESWFINGEIIIDVIFPAILRRKEQQEYQDVVTGALVQQFRRDAFFLALDAVVPCLNELGKRFDVDKSLGFNFGKDGGEQAPLTQMRANFRMDLRIWDEFLVSDDRTKNDPFEKTLADLSLITTIIENDYDSNTIESVQTL